MRLRLRILLKKRNNFLMFLYRNEFKIWFLARRKLSGFADHKLVYISNIDQFVIGKPRSFGEAKNQILKSFRYIWQAKKAVFPLALQKNNFYTLGIEFLFIRNYGCA